MPSPLDILGELAQQLRARRDVLDISQVEAAARLGVSERTYQDWEAGRATPQPRNREAVTHFLADAVLVLRGRRDRAHRAGAEQHLVGGELIRQRQLRRGEA